MIGRFPGETYCLTMAWAVMDLHAIAALIAARAVPQTAQQIA